MNSKLNEIQLVYSLRHIQSKYGLDLNIYIISNLRFI